MLEGEKVYKKCSGSCKGLGGTHRKEDVYCWQCGLPLEKWLKKCTSCGVQLSQYNSFCTVCGKPATEVKIAGEEVENNE
jgi:predicted amidophosphoribosyltransferase